MTTPEQSQIDWNNITNNLCIKKLTDIKYIIFYDHKSPNENIIQDLASGKKKIKLKTRVTQDKDGQLQIYKDILRSAPKYVNQQKLEQSLNEIEKSKSNYETDFYLEDDHQPDQNNQDYQYYDDEEDDEQYMDLDEEGLYLEDKDYLIKKMEEEIEQQMEQDIINRLLEENPNEEQQTTFNNIIMNNLHHSSESITSSLKSGSTQQWEDEQDGWVTDDEDDFMDEDDEDYDVEIFKTPPSEIPAQYFNSNKK